ncbi:11444_t:CDS:2 [Entrophospora sp. SA101]|nr:11444_t:CDS:2 [Entrophospora sp. SA101]
MEVAHLLDPSFHETSVWKRFSNESEGLDKNLLGGDIEFIENENEESEYFSNSSSGENEKENQESVDFYDSDVTY